MLTAATGMDAIAHCIETFMAPAFNPPADGIALDGLWRAWAHIERATAEPRRPRGAAEHDERVDAGRAGVPEGPGLRAQPEPRLGGINPRLHHGTLNAIFLPAVIDFNADAPTVRDERKLERLRRPWAWRPGRTSAPRSTT